MPLTDEDLIERVRRALDALNRGDFDAAIEMAHPRVVFVRLGGQSELRGAAALREWMEPDAFQSLRIEPIHFEVSGNLVLVRSTSTATGAGSGIEMELAFWGVWTFDREGRATRIEAFLDHQEDEARRAFEGS